MRLTEPQTPHIAIPTTAGTGREVTNVAVIHNAKLDRKVYIVDANIIPNVAILDPRLTISLPARLTAATGMDAITHAVEALTSTLAQTVCDGQALHALRLMKEFLPRAVAAVRRAGRLIVKRGSRIATFGMMFASTIYTFRSSFALWITATLVTSLPVPAVVGMAMCGVCGSVRRMSAMWSFASPPFFRVTQTGFAVSMTLPPPTLTMQSAAGASST